MSKSKSNSRNKRKTRRASGQTRPPRIPRHSYFSILDTLTHHYVCSGEEEMRGVLEADYDVFGDGNSRQEYVEGWIAAIRANLPNYNTVTSCELDKARAIYEAAQQENADEQE